MARYRKIDVRMWGDRRFRVLSAPPVSGKYLWIFLLTGPHTTNLPGLFRSGEKALAEELDWPLEGFRKGFAELSREGLAKADWNARVVWVPNAIKYNPPDNPNVVKSWRNSWDEIPECALKTEAFERLKQFTKGLGEGFAKAFREGCANGLANQEQEQEQEKDTLPGTKKSSGGSVSALREKKQRTFIRAEGHDATAMPDPSSSFNPMEVAHILCQKNGMSGRDMISALRGAIEFQATQMPERELEQVGEWLVKAYFDYKQNKGAFAVGPQKFFEQGLYRPAADRREAKADVLTNNPATRMLAEMETA